MDEQVDSPEPQHRGLRAILVSVFSGVLFGLFLSRRERLPPLPPDSTSSKTQYGGEGILPLRAPHISPSSIQSENPCKCRHHKTPWWKITLDVVTLAATVGAFIAAAIYVCISYRIWRDTLNAFRVDERAWVGIEPIKPKLKAPASGKFPSLFTYDVYARNSGKTVARCVEIRAPREGAGSVGHFENEEWMSNLQDKFLLGKYKNSSDIPIIRSAPKVLAPGQLTPLAVDFSGQAPVIYPDGGEWVSTLVGRIDYIDEFRVRHWVKFCFVVEPGGELEYCKYGNDEDNNAEIPPSVEPSCPVMNPSPDKQ
jgi:hypothetical protein